jgi:hypothetical protein
MQHTKRIPGTPLDLRGCRVSQASGIIVVAIGTNRLQHHRDQDQRGDDQHRRDLKAAEHRERQNDTVVHCDLRDD